MDCSGKPDESQCQFECEMTIGNGNEKFEALLRVCMIYWTSTTFITTLSYLLAKNFKYLY